MQVRGIPPIQISGLTLRKRAGKPGCCQINLHVPDDALGDLLKKEDLAIMHNEGEPLFFGKTVLAEICKAIGGNSARLVATSWAWEESEIIHRRFFQKPEKTFGDVLKRLKLENCKLDSDSELAQMACEPLLLQRESNIAFLKRLAKLAGRRLWIVDNRENSPGLMLANCLNDSVKTIRADTIFQQRLIRKNGKKCLRICGRTYLPLGQMAQIEGMDDAFLAVAICCRSTNGRDEFICDLEEYSGQQEPDQLVEGPGLLPGTVKDAHDPDKLGRLQVAIDPAYAEDSKELSWLPLITPYAGRKAGLCFLPDENDRVLVHVANGEAFVSGALRTEKLGDEFAHPQDKCLGNNFSESIIWKEQALELHSGENSLILDEEGLKLHTPKADFALSESGAELTSGASVNVSADKELKMAANGNAYLSGKRVELG